jgi:hypothetical protein
MKVDRLIYHADRGVQALAEGLEMVATLGHQREPPPAQPARGIVQQADQMLIACADMRMPASGSRACAS